MISRIILLLLFMLVAAHGSPKTIPRTHAGQPNFDGVWYYGSATPFERPLELGTRKTYSAAEAQTIVNALQKQDADRLLPSDPNRAPPESISEVGQEADDNFVTTRTNLTRIDGNYRTSLITDPTNGQLPVRADGQDIFDELHGEGIGPFDGPEIRPASERCLSVAGPIAPTVGWYYNANMRIVQTNDHIVIKGEMLKPRIVPLDKNASTRGFVLWLGESVAYWDEDILVIKSTNFRPENSWFRFKSSEQLEITEYFELTKEDEIVYRYEVSDPKIYSAPFTVEMSITRRLPGEFLFEFACHEANYSLPAILRGARLTEPH